MKTLLIVVLFFSVSSCKGKKDQKESKKGDNEIVMTMSGDNPGNKIESVKRKRGHHKGCKHGHAKHSHGKHPHGKHDHALNELSKGKGNPHMHPKMSMGEYILRLEDPNRIKWQKPDEVIEALNLKGTETITDLGAGSGFFSFRFAEALPNGKVIACDIEDKMIGFLNKKIMKLSSQNVISQKIDPNKPQIDKNSDYIFVNNVLHHVDKKVSWLKTIKSQMKPGAKLVILEFKMGKIPAGPPESMRLTKKQILKLTKDAGFENHKEILNVLKYQEFLVFKN